MKIKLKGGVSQDETFPVIVVLSKNRTVLNLTLAEKLSFYLSFSFTSSASFFIVDFSTLAYVSIVVLGEL